MEKNTSSKAAEELQKATTDFTIPPMSEQVRENLSIITDYFNLDAGRCLSGDVMDLLDEVYFRSKLVGFEENYPQRNNPHIPLIFASNHSGMAFPWDGMLLSYKIHSLCNYGTDAIRPLAAPMLSASVLMNTFQIKHFWKTMGSVDATYLNFETMMYQNDFNLLIYPEGVPGIGKGFDKRYRLQRLSSSMIQMSIKFKTDIIPFATVNGEYINPYTYSSPWLNRIVNKIGIPFLPIGLITPFILMFPWIFYMGFPARLTFVLGKRIKPYEMTDKPFEEMTYEDFREVSEKVHAQMQAELTAAEKEYGQQPYKWGEFFGKILKSLKHFPYTLPIGWPLLFAEFERVRFKKKNTDPKQKLKLGFLSTLRILLQNPFTLFYYLPLLGWIPLGLKGFRKVKY